MGFFVCIVPIVFIVTRAVGPSPHDSCGQPLKTLEHSH